MVARLMVCCQIMDSMILAYLSRIVLRGIALVLGSLGIFSLYWTCVGAPFAAYAIVCLGGTTTIILASDSEGAVGTLSRARFISAINRGSTDRWHVRFGGQFPNPEIMWWRLSKTRCLSSGRR